MMFRTRYYCARIGFTLIELMVAVVVLLVVMVAVGRIFSTTSAISASGRAIAETLQQGVAIEQQLREDIANISREGFLGIRSVAVPNNLKGEYLLIDDSLPTDAIIRCDQLMFFTDGIATPMLNTGNTDFAGQGLATRVYYGHGLSFPQLDGIEQGANTDEESDDPLFYGSAIPGIKTPWYEGAIEVETRLYPEAQATRFDIVASGAYANGTQNHPSDWILCRQAVILADDDDNDPIADSKKTYMRRGVSSQTIFPWDPRIGGSYTFPHVLHGRVDIAATQLDDVRQCILQEVEFGDENRQWRNEDTSSVTDQQQLIASLFYWPRVEPYPPTAIRYDQALMMPAIAQGCISFQVEWTYDEGVGEAVNANNIWYSGYQYDDVIAQPWFGSSYTYNLDGESDQYNIAFRTLTQFTLDANDGSTNDFAPVSVEPYLIEPYFDNSDAAGVVPIPTIFANGARTNEYWALFGYNGHDPFMENDVDFLNGTSGDSTWRYTPWPSALRITLRLLDRNNRLGAGWTYQFVVDLPERN
jgi:prepilin-type N-terminal cleavage/methylation domain-containing protein